MTSTPQRFWAAVPAILRAALHAAWAASKVGAISFATFFMIANLAYGVYGAAGGHIKIQELPYVIVGGAGLFLLSLLLSFVITVPVSSVIAACAYPFLRTLRAANRLLFGIVGFLIGALVWLAIFWSAPAGNLYFGSWISLFLIGGPAGGAGGLAFARHLPQETLVTELLD